MDFFWQARFSLIPSLLEAKKLYKATQEKYSRGEVDEAITDLENALEIDSVFWKAEEFLLKILVTANTEYYAEGDYERSFLYLTKAYNLGPKSGKVTYMYEIVLKESKGK